MSAYVSKSVMFTLPFIDRLAVRSALFLPIQEAASFGDSSQVQGSVGNTVETRRVATQWQRYSITIVNVDPVSYGVGGWTFDQHHFYDRLGGRLFLGSGRILKADRKPG